MLVFVAVALPALIGLIGLALDGVRLMSLDTELADRADAAALAAASRLDRSSGAIVQARRAALAVAAVPGAPPRRLGFRFAASLNDLDARGAQSLPDEAGSEASVVEVSASEASFSASLIGLVGGHAPPLMRRATAESRYYACDVTPLALCHTDPSAFVASARPGRQVLLRADGNLLSGSVALLERSADRSGRQAILTLASDRPAFCYADGTRRRANVGPDDFDEALNVRFDRYTGRNGPIPPDLAAFPPAPVVVTGRHLATCRSPPGGGEINPPFPIPRDTVFQGFRPSAAWNAGTGDWKIAPPLGGLGLGPPTAFEEYFAWNHAQQGVGTGDRLRRASTRWDLYLAELGLTRQTETQSVDTRSLGSAATTIPSGGPSNGPLSLRRENAVPICYGGARRFDQARRRILYMSVVDCRRLGEDSTAEELSRIVAKMFLTETSDGGMIFVELVGFLTPSDDDGKLRHVVQLVRTQ